MKFYATIMLMLILFCSCSVFNKLGNSKNKPQYYEYYKAYGSNSFTYVTIQIHDDDMTYKATGWPYTDNGYCIEMECLSKYRATSFLPLNIKSESGLEFFSGKRDWTLDYSKSMMTGMLLLNRYTADILIDSLNLDRYSILQFPPYFVKVKKTDQSLFKAQGPKPGKPDTQAPTLSDSQFLPCNTQIEGKAWADEKLKGKVKIVISSSERMEFNRCGYLTRKCEFTYQDTNRIKQENYYRYNTDNQLIEEISYDYDWGNEKVFRYFYNGHGQLQEKHTFEAGEIWLRKIYFYEDQKYPCKSETYFTNDKEPSLFTSYQYDSEGNLTEELTINEDSIPHNRNVLTYDDRRNRISEESYSYDFDEKNLNLFIKSTTRYDKHNNRIEYNSCFRLDNYREIKQLMDYDADNNQIHFQQIDTSTGQITWESEYTYQYDNRGNWITQFRDENILQNERTVEYWDE